MGTVLITGCSSGIGFETALAAARAGHFVYAGVRNLGVADTLIAASSDLAITPLELDITKAFDRDAALTKILRERGRLDALINNAGVTLGGFLEQVEETELRDVFEANVFGAWLMSRACIPYLRKTKAKLIFISSMAGRSAFPMLGAYAASKFALEGLAEAWRHELRLFGVDVVLVEPGAHKTEIFGRNRRMTVHHGESTNAYGDLGRKLDAWFQKGIDQV